MGRAHEVRKVAMAKTAAAKAKLYSRYGKELYLAAKAGGTDPDGNLTLRRLIAKAKKEQVPANVIKNAIDRVKSGATENYEEKTFEGYGPNGSTVIVKCLTDNINRTISQVRPAFTKSKAKLGNEGSVSYLYDTYSILTFKGLDEEQTLEALMEADADCQEIETLEDGSIELTGAPTDLYKMKEMWSYMAPLFTDYKRYAKKIRKCEKCNAYEKVIDELFSQEDLEKEPGRKDPGRKGVRRRTGACRMMHRKMGEKAERAGNRTSHRS